jgi:uroporphyrinogen-III synthase
MAAEVTRAGGWTAGEGWFDRTVQRLSTLVTIRRVDGRSDGSPDAVLAEAERFLKANDLLACVQALERLTGDSAQAAAPWLKGALARVAVERALAALHVHAISLLAPAKE